MHCYPWLKRCYYVGENVHNLLIFVNLQVVQESAYTQLEKKKEKKKETFPSFNNVIAQIFVFSTFKSVISMVLALKLNFFCYFKEFLTPMSAVYNYIFILFIT